jgi:large subunit ribosomal protein L3
MMIGLIGRKVGMTQLYNEKGILFASTVLEIGPCPVIQVKTTDGKDGYNSVKLGFGNSKKVNKPETGIMTKVGLEPVKCMHEFKVDNVGDYQVGTVLKADVFAVGDTVLVTGTSKGRGFAGVIKRHKFSGGKDSHGCRSKRVPGSIGSSSDPSRVMKGKKMPGHFGNHRHTTRGLEVLLVDAEKNVIFVKGAIPGAPNGIVYLTKQQ